METNLLINMEIREHIHDTHSRTPRQIMSNLPIDRKPCPVCPIEIRNLFAVAYNLTMGTGLTPGRIEDLRQAVLAVQPLIDSHFADRLHSHGDVA